MKILLSFSLIIALALFACTDTRNPVPYSSISLTIYNIESDAQYIELRANYAGVLIKNDYECYGYNCNGILLYRVKVNYDIDDFVAYDATCPHEVNDCIMEIDPAEPYYAVCGCCGSRFNLVGDYLETGPSNHGLRKLNCEFTDGNLYIY